MKAVPGPSRDSRNLFIEISAVGHTKPSKQASARLAEVPGLWRVFPEIGRLLLLERVVDNRDLSRVKSPEREIRIAGVFDSPGMLANVFNLVQMAKWDGAMHIAEEQVRKVLYFRRGVYLSGRSSLGRDRLGNVLVRVGMITEGQRDACVEEVSDGARLGALLVSQGIMTTPKVYEGLRRQAEEIFFSTLRFSRGSYYLVEPLNMTDVPSMLRLDIRELLLEGMRRLDEETTQGDVPSDRELQRPRPIAPDKLPQDGPARIVETYNDALQRLFMAIDERDRELLRQELAGFLDDSPAYEELFDGVSVEQDGTLRGDILSNLRWVTTGEPVTILQLGLNEMLFFAMFAAGDALRPQVEQVLQRHVAKALEKLPKPEG
jgi:hypothetical protein